MFQQFNKFVFIYYYIKVAISNHKLSYEEYCLLILQRNHSITSIQIVTFIIAVTLLQFSYELPYISIGYKTISSDPLIWILFATSI